MDRGRDVQNAEVDPSPNPARPSELVAEASRAGAAEADEAIAAARDAFPRWRATPVAERAAVLLRAAAWLRERRDEVAATEIFEVGKPWREADADVCEAIDFLEYYGREMLRIARRKETLDVPGERNASLRRRLEVVIGRGITTRIGTGMSAARSRRQRGHVKPAGQARLRPCG